MNVLMVCAGNTCRSPMAAGLLRKLTQENAAVWDVRSAGLAYHPGAAIAENAIAVMRDIGIDISGDYSKPVTPEMMEWADLVLAMQEGQADHLLEEFPGSHPKIRHLQRDVFDPYCEDLDEYRKCRDLLAGLLSEFVASLKLSSLMPRALMVSVWLRGEERAEPVGTAGETKESLDAQYVHWRGLRKMQEENDAKRRAEEKTEAKPN